ncbi:MAG TPA: 3-dehydroquinate synthase family protein [Ktedonobacteraceae bacterium]|nr:3-dehydroquinate synthase family protein [Ktedonobacteraceae bacterium]
MKPENLDLPFSDSRFTRLRLSTASASTEVIVGHNTLDHACNLLEMDRSVRLVLITDQHIAPLYARSFCQLLEQKGYQIHLLEIASGEQAKTLETLLSLYEACLDLQLERDDVVITMGGGAIEDVGGLLAGTYLRGLDLMHIPTSLVGMVSSSIGGKVAINFRGAKNVIGAFKFPKFILMDLNFLDTLPDLERRSGIGELITVGVLGAPAIFEALEAHGTANLQDLIVAAIQCKAALVEADPFDQSDIRARLNLGHTFGHALEKLSGFRLPHGLAVAIGLHIASRLAASIGLCPDWLPTRIYQTLQALDLPTTLTGYHPADVLSAMKSDKKRARGLLRYVLPTAIGDVVLVSEDQVPPACLEEVLREIVGSEGTKR